MKTKSTMVIMVIMLVITFLSFLALINKIGTYDWRFYAALIGFSGFLFLSIALVRQVYYLIK